MKRKHSIFVVMKIKNLVSVALACALAACGGKQASPVEAAITEKVSAQLGELKSIYFESLELVDSTTFGEELARRRNVLDIRYKQNLKLAKDYEAAGKVRNELKKREDAANDLKHLEGLAELERRITEHDSLGVTEAYIYKFCAKANTDAGWTDIKDMFIAITPSYEIVGMDYKKEGVLKGTGRLIPGYQDLFK